MQVDACRQNNLKDASCRTTLLTQQIIPNGVIDVAVAVRGAQLGSTSGWSATPEAVPLPGESFVFASGVNVAGILTCACCYCASAVGRHCFRKWKTNEEWKKFPLFHESHRPKTFCHNRSVRKIEETLTTSEECKWKGVWPFFLYFCEQFQWKIQPRMTIAKCMNTEAVDLPHKSFN